MTDRSHLHAAAAARLLTIRTAAPLVAPRVRKVDRVSRTAYALAAGLA